MICIQDISGCGLAYQLTTIAKEIDERKEGKDRSCCYYYLSVLPRTAVSARTREGLLKKIAEDCKGQPRAIDKITEEVLQRDKLAENVIDFQPIGW